MQASSSGSSNQSTRQFHNNVKNIFYTTAPIAQLISFCFRHLMLDGGNRGKIT